VNDDERRYISWLKVYVPCAARELGPCGGGIEADHQGDIGEKGIGLRAGSWFDCVPMCSKHHRERTDHCGAFDGWDRERQFAWRAANLERMRDLWAAWEAGIASW
jgi:hypothetical protein